MTQAALSRWLFSSALLLQGHCLAQSAPVPLAPAIAESKKAQLALNGSSDDLDANCDGDDWQKRECQSRRIQVLDAKLNSVYELVLSKAATREDGPDFIRALRKSQRAWLAFKDSNCEVYAVLPMARSDTWKTLYRQDCLAETLKERIEELTRIANNE